MADTPTVTSHRRPATRGDRIFLWGLGLAQAIFLPWIILTATYPEPVGDGFTKGEAIWTLAFMWIATSILLGAAYTLKKALKR